MIIFLHCNNLIKIAIKDRGPSKGHTVGSTSSDKGCVFQDVSLGASSETA